jgi:hypothetical protein
MPHPFPRFEFDRILLPPESLRYSPTNEWIFPGLFRAGRHLTDPLGEWYLYYSPHDAPGGICLAYADALEGPWTEYADNPLIGRDWEPHYRVSHVASPHPLWIPEENRLFLWFHGENTTTRYATSTDGVTFSYEGVAVDVNGFEAISECSYARVFEHSLPDKGARYVLLAMGNNHGTRRLYLAWSADARTWETRREPVVSPLPDLPDGQTSAPWLMRSADGLYLLHHIDTPGDGRSAFYVTQCEEALTRFDTCTDVLYQPTDGLPDDGRVADVLLVEEGGELYLFYAAGKRLQGRIALARPV